MLAANIPQDPYNFSAVPRVVKPRSKYREIPQEEQQITYASNIMYDRRVVRGNTYAALVTTSREAMMQDKLNQSKTRRTKPVKQVDTTDYEAARADVSTPRPIDGRKHIQLQTDENVELLTDKPPCYEKDAQTDFYIDRPVNRLFIPQKMGEDRETQIWDGELFDFDYEVEPVLQVLIGKTLEQGRMEVLEEEELRVMREEQKRYDELRYAEIAEAQRMEAEERRRMEENERRKKQHKLKKEQVATCHKKLISRLMAKEYLKNVRANALGTLAGLGTFGSSFNFELNHSYLPWTFNDVLHLQEHRSAIINTIKAFMETTTKNLENIHQKAVEAEMERRRLAKEEKERLEREKKERREKRAEARKKRDEELRRKAIQDKVTEALLGKAEERQRIFTQVISDIDSLGKEGMTVGLLGGVIGEILIILSTLNDFKAPKENDPLAASLKNIDVTKDTVQKVVDFVVGELIKDDGKIEIGVTGEIEPRLEAIDPELNLENLHTKADKANEIREFLTSSINSFVLSVIKENAEKLDLKAEYVEMITNAIINLILSPEDKARKIKLVKAPLDYNQETRFEAIAILMPNIEEAHHYNLAEVKGPKQPKKGAKNVKKASVPSIEAPIKSEESELSVVSPAEIDYEDVVSVFPLYNEEIRVLAHQAPASIVFRREVLLFLSNIFKDLDMKEIEVLKRVNNKAEGIEELIASRFAKNLFVLTFERN